MAKQCDYNKHYYYVTITASSLSIFDAPQNKNSKTDPIRDPPKNHDYSLKSGLILMCIYMEKLRSLRKTPFLT